MRFVHTSDWHLGRLFHGRHLTEDQDHVLDQLLELLAECRPDALLISGDVYDRAVPPVEAVRLLERVLERVVMDLRIPVIAIAGNHDSAERLGFGSRFLAERGLHVVGPLAETPTVVSLADEHGPVHFHPIPYAEPGPVRILTGDADIHTHDAALRALVQRSRATMNTDAQEERHVLLAHAFVAGGTESESERPLSVGGSGLVQPDAFGGFDYVALGHLHRPQRTGGAEHIRYSGSLLKYSFSEADHRKAVLVVDMDAQGRCNVEAVPLQPRHDVRIIEGRLEDLLHGPDPEENPQADPNDYLLVRLTDKRALLNPMGKLREVYPNVLQIERVPVGGERAGSAASVAQRRLPTGELFRDFFREVSGEALDEAQQAVLLEVLEELTQEEQA